MFIHFLFIFPNTKVKRYDVCIFEVELYYIIKAKVSERSFSRHRHVINRSETALLEYWLTTWDILGLGTGGGAGGDVGTELAADREASVSVQKNIRK